MSTMTGNEMRVKPGLGKSLLTVALVTAAILMIPSSPCSSPPK